MKTKIVSSTFAFMAGCAVMGFIMLNNDDSVSAQESGNKAPAASTDETFYMLNALWFKEDGGAEKYTEYLNAAGPFVAKHGGKSDGAYIPEASMIGKFDADLVFFVEWPNQAAFLGLIQDPGYKAISHLRDEAIDDSLLIRCRKMGVGSLGK